MSPQKERLDKRLAREGFGTRSEIRKAVGAGKVSVNGQTEKDPGRKITPEDEVCFDGKKVGQEAFVYYMLNKPAGVITATEDDVQQTVLDLLRSPSSTSGKAPGTPVFRRGIFPVGRLDRDTEGLLLVTDDGQLAHRLLAPGRHVDKVYYALVTGKVTGEEIRKFAEGLQVGKEGSSEAFTALPAKLEEVRRGTTEKEELFFAGSALPARAEAAGRGAAGKAELFSAGSAALPAGAEAVRAESAEGQEAVRPDPPEAPERTEVLVTIREGKYHQIKRMFRAVGKEVLYLKRLSMGPLCLDAGLAPGEFRALRREEIEALSAALEMIDDGRRNRE